MSHHARAHSWRAAYSTTLAIATTATNEQASKGHLLRPADAADAAADASLISPNRLQQHQRNWKVGVWKGGRVGGLRTKNHPNNHRKPYTFIKHRQASFENHYFPPIDELKSSFWLAVTTPT